MTVRCKFRCQQKTATEQAMWNGHESAPSITYSYKFYVVTSGSEENKAFYAATPAGTLDVSCVKNDLFTPGKEYYLDLVEVD